MRLDFNVLWVDDQADELRGTRDGLARRFSADGFQLNPTFCGTITEVKAFLAESVFSDEVDLVLVDWELGSGDQGQNAIETIREPIPFKDIIFYSARADTAELRKLAYERQLDGVYFASRNDLITEVMGVFNSLVKKALDLDHIRGIVMGATSDIDQLVREALEAAHDRSTPEGQKAILDEMLELLDEKLPNLQKRIEKLKANPAVKAIISEHFTFSANDGLRILSRVLASNEFENQNGFVGPLKQYMTKVVPKRNILGHKVLSPEGKPIGLAGESVAEVISFEEMKDLRKILLELRSSFREMFDSLRVVAGT